MVSIAVQAPCRRLSHAPRRILSGATDCLDNGSRRLAKFPVELRIDWIVSM